MDVKEQLDAWQNLSTPEELRSVLEGFDIQKATSPQISRINRLIDHFDIEPSLRIALLGNFEMGMLPPYIKAYFFEHGYDTECYVGSYNQYFQEVLIEDGKLKKFSPDLVFLCLTMKNLEPDIAERFSGLSNEDRQRKLDDILKRIEDWIVLARKRLGSLLVLSNFPIPSYPQLGVADLSETMGEINFFQQINSQIASMVIGKPDLQIFNMAGLVSRFGADNVLDPKLYYMAKMMWSDKFLPVLASELLRIHIAVKGVSKKCLVLDLDNTLWGGVIGEDGPHSVKIGVGDPVSEAFRDFQLRLLALKNRGIMLAICSKNNEADVEEMFEIRKDMPLRLDDFASMRINWQNKGQNIQELAAEMNIGLDSLVFLDDNPAECAIVREMLPEVTTIHLPPQPERYPSLIDRLPYFEKRTILASDSQKTIQYTQNRQRQALQSKTADLSTYLYSLETTVDIRRPRQADLERIHQLFTKTNQFNVTTIRHSPAEIHRFCETNDNDLFLVSAGDKFGDLGIIGLYLLQRDDQGAEIDSFIMSCRAMGRGIESAIMNHLKSHCFDLLHLKSVDAHYLPTKKNIPVETFFEDQGFEITKKEEAGIKHYRLIKKASKFKDCSWIQVTAEDT